MKVVATGMLVVMAVIYVIARANQDKAGWIGYVRAAAEAGMVGALADWFAVTALFRHPLGLPIPHTAIIPRRKDMIGRSLGEFVEGNFLTRDVIGERLAGAQVASRLGRWLAQPDNAERAGAAIGDAVGGVVEVLDDSDVQSALGAAVERRLNEVRLAPLAARMIEVGIEGNHHQRLFDAVLSGVSGFLDDNRDVLREQLDKESPWWSPEVLDDKIFAKAFGGVQRFLAEVRGNPAHDVRRSVGERLAQLGHDLRDDPGLSLRLDDLKREVLDHPEVQAWLQSLWGEVKRATLAAADDPDSELRRRLVGGLAALGRRLQHDPELQAKVDGWVERLVAHVVDNYRSEVAELIAGTVARWDAADTSRRIELQVGRDLQFIRINGTVVGALAGLLIHTVSETLL